MAENRVPSTCQCPHCGKISIAAAEYNDSLPLISIFDCDCGTNWTVRVERLPPGAFMPPKTAENSAQPDKIAITNKTPHPLDVNVRLEGESLMVEIGETIEEYHSENVVTAPCGCITRTTYDKDGGVVTERTVWVCTQHRPCSSPEIENSCVSFGGTPPVNVGKNGQSRAECFTALHKALRKLSDAQREKLMEATQTTWLNWKKPNIALTPVGISPLQSAAKSILADEQISIAQHAAFENASFPEDAVYYNSKGTRVLANPNLKLSPPEPPKVDFWHVGSDEEQVHTLDCGCVNRKVYDSDGDLVFERHSVCESHKWKPKPDGVENAIIENASDLHKFINECDSVVAPPTEGDDMVNFFFGK